MVDTLLQNGASVDIKNTVSVQLTEPSFTSGWYFTSTESYNNCVNDLCGICMLDDMIAHSLCLLHTLTIRIIAFIKAPANC